ncbi:MAG: DUF2254 domain-containing protein [Sphingobacteriales bacterium]|nr:MAG: DUF2254 domain-containing protein [Sphingobacteriales bacterium]
MFTRLKARFLKIFYSATGSLAFIPLMIMLCFALLGFTILGLEDYDLGKGALLFLGWAITQDPTQASAIITTLLAGLISITVFSFSMVMVVINQASTQFTPRVITYITRNRENQFVLGFYIGTIFYYIILLLNYTRKEDEIIVPSLAFAIAIILGITSLMLFVRFIHTISVSVQVNNIIILIYRTVKSRLERLLEENERESDEDVQNLIISQEWFTYNSPQSGYIQSVLPGAVKAAKKHDVIIRLDLPAGEYVLKGNPLYFLNKKVEEDCEKELAAYFDFDVVSDAREHSHYAFVQLTEIACKALSPGINDPGTARMCIDYLTDMMLIRSRLPDSDMHCDDENNTRVIIKHFTYSNIVKSTLTPIRHYGNNDVQILNKLLQSIYKLALNDWQARKFSNLYNENAEAVLESAKHGLYNPADKKNINQTVQILNSMERYFTLTEI